MKKQIDQAEIGELLSAYVDGELTQQQRQYVALQIENNADYKRKVEEIAALKEAVGNMKEPMMESERIDAILKEPTSRVFEIIGFSALTVGVSIVIVFAVISFLISPDIGIGEKVVASLIWGGLLGVFIAVARQQYMARKSDKYKGVKL